MAYQRRSQNLNDVRSILRPIIGMINEEIKDWKPTSFQENLKNGVFQISIFDRTSSSSDSVPSAPGPSTPAYRPTPPPLNDETIFGFPIKKTVDSPGSFWTVSPGVKPKLVDHTLETGTNYLEDFGYDSDREGQPGSSSMRPTWSERTARPPSEPRSQSGENRNEGWQLVSSRRRKRRQPCHRDLGSFRPTPAKAKFDRRNAVTSRGPGEQDRTQQKRKASPAPKASEKLQCEGPLPSQEDVASFQRRPFGKTSAASVTGPTWAGVVAGRKPFQQQPVSGAGKDQTSPSAARAIIERGWSNESLRSWEENPLPQLSTMVPELRP